MSLPVYVISLTDSHDRRATISSALDALGVPFQFFDAIDGREALPPDYEAQVDREGAARAMGRPMSDGEFAAALSHLHLYKKIVASGAEHALVFEDDAQPTKDLAGFLAAKAYQAAPLVMLHHLNARVMPGAPTPLFGDVYAHRLAVPSFRATAYTISKAAAQWILERALPVTAAADWPADITRLGALALEPQIVHHPPDAPGQSTLAPKRATRGGARLHRFMDPAYVRRVWRKARSTRIS